MTGPGSNSQPLDLQSDSHLLPDTLPTALRGLDVKYELASSTLATLVKTAAEIKNSYLNRDYKSKRKPLRPAGYPEVEEALLKWFKSARDVNVPISCPFLKRKRVSLLNS